jgi:hypothetical protein
MAKQPHHDSYGVCACLKGKGKGRWPNTFITIMPLCLDSYVPDLHAYSIHERHHIPFDKPHRLGDVGAHSLFLIPRLKIVSNHNVCNYEKYGILNFG